MKKRFSILLIIFLALAGCQKDPELKFREFPFENDAIKMELVATNLPDSVNRVNMHFFDDSIGIIISREGEIYKTKDGGRSWTLKYTNPTKDQPFFEIVFTDKNIGYVVGGANWCNGNGCICPGGIVLKTTDAGETWSPIFALSGQLEFKDIASNSKGELFLIQNEYIGPNQPASKILKSTDGGSSWTMVSQFSFVLYEIIFNKNVGFCTILDSKNTMIESQDHGTTWANSASFSDGTIRDLAFYNNVGMCIFNNMVYKTINNGTSWAKLFNTSNYGLGKINLLSETDCIIWGGIYSRGCFGYTHSAFNQTQNGGTYWTGKEFLETYGTLYISSFYSATEGYVLADKLIKVTVK